MQNVILNLSGNGYGDFLIMGKKEQLATMKVGVSGIIMTVHYTCITPEGEGKGFAKKLLAAMINYVRINKLKVVPSCHFVREQFNRHPKKFADVWYKGKADIQIKSKSEPLLSA